MIKVGAGATGAFDPTEYFFDATTGLMTKVRYTSDTSTFDANYFYDSLARVVKITDWIDGTNGLRYGYDDGGRLTSITDYDDPVLTYAYDARSTRSVADRARFWSITGLSRRTARIVVSTDSGCRARRARQYEYASGVIV